MIKLRNINFGHPKQPNVFQDFSWEVNAEETWAVLGPSGCGKSTLLFLLAGLRFPTKGSITINGNALSRPRPQTGLIIQEYGLLPWATVMQNAALGLQIRGFYGPDGTHVPENYKPGINLDSWLSRLGLETHLTKYPSQLSGGQRQRTAIARTLALEPDLILMDEPFSSLDAPTREALQNLIIELQSEQALTMVVVTHSIEEAAILGKKVLIMIDPPNYAPNILVNPGAGKHGFRESEEYLMVCRQLRSMLERNKIGNRLP